MATVDELRTAAVTVLEPHSSGILRLQSYAAQLVWMGGKFPIDIGADFTWYDGLGYGNSGGCEFFLFAYGRDQTSRVDGLAKQKHDGTDHEMLSCQHRRTTSVSNLPMYFLISLLSTTSLLVKLIAAPLKVSNLPSTTIVYPPESYHT